MNSGTVSNHGRSRTSVPPDSRIRALPIRPRALSSQTATALPAPGKGTLRTSRRPGFEPAIAPGRWREFRGLRTPMDRADDGVGPLLHLGKDLRYVQPDKADEDQVDAAHEADRDHEGSPSLDRVSEQDQARREVDHPEESDRADDRTEKGREQRGTAAERRDRSDGLRQALQVAVRARALVGLVDRQSHLP